MSLLSISRKKDKKEQQAATSSLPTEVAKDEIVVSEASAKQIPIFAKKEGHDGGLLRIGIKGGGCSGLSYHFSITLEPTEQDQVFGTGNSRICVDPKSMKVLGGTILDYLQELGRAEFVMRNPNAKSTCSCGQSFSL
jgi:iron-sulfur cluster assembly protein